MNIVRANILMSKNVKKDAGVGVGALVGVGGVVDVGTELFGTARYQARDMPYMCCWHPHVKSFETMDYVMILNLVKLYGFCDVIFLCNDGGKRKLMIFCEILRICDFDVFFTPPLVTTILFERKITSFCRGHRQFEQHCLLLGE